MSPEALLLSNPAGNSRLSLAMAPAAFIFDHTFRERISIHLRADFGLPQGIFGGIGHHGGSPLRIVGYIVADLVCQAAVTQGTDAGARKIVSL